ncbi:OB-fold nucleic acid binding domain-containing protein [Sporobolomyces salmoneus]|uniref:OB-fold nucleic acid binding domain-containing protein n=1 Tax=Sporobolomyces salmoneus TaxID=183962 RepID=UPI003176D88F
MSPTRTPLLSRTSSRGLVPSSSSLDTNHFSSSKPTTPSQGTSQLKAPSTFTLLPPPSQASQSTTARKKRKLSSQLPSQSQSQSQGNLSSRVRPTPRPIGEPRPPTATKTKSTKRKSLSGESPSTSSQHSLPCPSSSSSLARDSPPPRPLSPRLVNSLARTDWTLLDPENNFLLSSSRLFQLSHLELGEITRQQNQGKDPKYGGSRREGKKRAREELDRLEEERLERSGQTDRKGKGKRNGMEMEESDVPSWAKDREGIEWEVSVLKKLSSRLSRLPSSSSSATSGATGVGEDFIPLVWLIDLEQKVRKASLGSLECWILGKEFPCRKVVVVGWILEREWRETEGRKLWIYTIDDGTALVQVICPVEDSEPTTPSSRTSTKPSLDPQLLIPKMYLPRKPPPSPPLKRSYSILESSVSASTTFSPQTLIRVVGTITPPPNQYQTELRITADRIEAVPPMEEMKHHAIVGKLWEEVYAGEVDVRGMSERIEREEEEVRRKERESQPMSTPGGGGSQYGDLSSCSGASSVASTPRYRPTRPAKLSPSDITLPNFIIYIRHHLLKHHVQTCSSSSSSSLFEPPPSSQGSYQSYHHHSEAQEEENERKDEWCLPFAIDELRNSNKHLELFAKRLSLERDRKEREKKRNDRKRQKRNGDLALLTDSTNSKEESVWVSSTTGGGGRVVKEGRKKVEMGSSKLVKMLLPPPSSATSCTTRTRSQVKREEDVDLDEEEEKELEGRKLEKEIKRSWEDAIRLMRKNGMIVEYVAQVDEEEEEELMTKLRAVKEEDVNSGLPDEPSHGSVRRGDTTPRRRLGQGWKPQPTPGEATPRASSRSNTSFVSASTSTTISPQQKQRQRFQLVTPLSLAPFILQHIHDISDSLPSSSRRSITEIDVRRSMYRDDRWSSVAKYGEVVRRSLEVLENWGEIEESGEGFRLA